MSLIKAKKVDAIYPDIWRVFISGSSSAGKTFFAKQLLSADLFDVRRIYYFHPDIQETFPIDWCDHFKKEIICQAGLPTMEDISQMPPHSVIVLDDLFTEVAQSKLMSYLFRVLSSKKKLHVIVMTQRYYAEGSLGLNIRNCSNYHILMSNADARTNMRVAFSMGLEKDVRKAIEINKSKLYPYIAIDRTNQARVNGLVVYTDIIDDFKKVVINGQLSVMVPHDIFNQKMEYTNDGFARPIEKKTGKTDKKPEKTDKKAEKTKPTEKENSIILEYSRMKRKLKRDRRRYKKKLQSKIDHL